MSTRRRFPIFLCLLPLSLIAQRPLPQIEQARQSAAAFPVINLQDTAVAARSPELQAGSTGDDAFGAQVILKRQEPLRPFTGFTEISAFATNNVALTRRDRQEDSFLVVSAGGSYSRSLGHHLRADAGVRSSAYRYGEFRELDFQSVDVLAGLAWSPPQLRGVEVFARYVFTDLSTAERVREFYTNHAILLGAQKVFPFSRAHGAYVGATAQWSATDPKESGRDEYTGFVGYRAQLTRSVHAELSYRFARYDYRHADGRAEYNQALAAGLHYVPVEWLSVSATTFYGVNRSNRRVFDYEVGNVGAGLQLSVRF